MINFNKLIVNNTYKQPTKKHQSVKMSSTKSHTKNQLARISAKINHLKRKYPPYLDQQNQSTGNETQNQQNLPKNLYEQHSYLYQKHIQKRASSSSNKYKNDSMILNGQKTENLIAPRIKEKDYFSSIKDLKDKQNIISMNLGIQKQKPFNQYKEELKHLKRQILSSLDFNNFQRKGTTQKLLNETERQQQRDAAIVTERKTNKVANLVNDKQQNTLHNNEVESCLQNSKTKLFMSQNSSNNKKELQKDKIQLMKKMILELSTELSNFKVQNCQRLTKMQNSFSKLELIENNNSQKIIEIEQKLVDLKQPSFQFKFIEMQNQSMTKLSKGIYNEIQKSNQQIQSIKCQLNTLKNIDTTVQEAQLKQVQSKMFKQIFDLRNQISLIEEKLKKEEYMEKSLKTLFNNEALKSFEKYCKEHFYFQILQDVTDMNSKFSNQLSDEIIENKAFTVKNIQRVDKQIQSLFNLLKQSDTKLVSYGILLETVEENLKQVIERQKIQQCQKLSNESLESQLVQVHERLNSRVSEEKIMQIETNLNDILGINLNIFGQDLQILKENLNACKFDLNILKSDSNVMKVDVKLLREQIENIKTNGHEKCQVSHGDSKLSICLQQSILIQPMIEQDNVFKEVNLKQFQFIKQQHKIFSENNLIQINIQQTSHSNNNSHFLLEDLLKNSLVFQAFNDKLY